jgi:hypothetical protein
MITGSVLSATLRAFDTTDDAGVQKLGRRLFTSPLGIGDAIASGAVVINGTVVVGTGVGFRGPNPNDPADAVSRIPSPIVALCVPGEPGCDIPRWRLSDLDDDGDVDDADRALFQASLGRASGAQGFLDWADLDRDGVVTLADYQRWLAGRREYENSLGPFCGLLGIEPVLLWAGLCLVRRARRR